MQALDVDYLAFSFHKMLAPFGVGVLYAREHLLRTGLPFLYGGDMIAEGRVFPDRVEYNALPWKYAAGTPDILGAIISAQALRLLVDLALGPDRPPAWFGTARPLTRAITRAAMDRISAWNQQLTRDALDGLSAHCRHNTAEFWVSGTTDVVVRRPWFRSCCQALDRSQCRVTPRTEEGASR